MHTCLQSLTGGVKEKVSAMKMDEEERGAVEKEGKVVEEERRTTRTAETKHLKSWRMRREEGGGVQHCCRGRGGRGVWNRVTSADRERC